MKDMIHYIIQSGELERFWTAVEKENLRIKKEAKREFQDRQRLAKGSEAEDTEPISETEESYDSEDYDSEESSSLALAPCFSESTDKKQEGFKTVKIEMNERSITTPNSYTPMAMDTQADVEFVLNSTLTRNSNMNVGQSIHSTTLSRSKTRRPKPFNALRFIAYALKRKAEERRRQETL